MNNEEHKKECQCRCHKEHDYYQQKVEEERIQMAKRMCEEGFKF